MKTERQISNSPTGSQKSALRTIIDASFIGFFSIFSRSIHTHFPVFSRSSHTCFSIFSRSRHTHHRISLGSAWHVPPMCMVSTRHTFSIFVTGSLSNQALYVHVHYLSILLTSPRAPPVYLFPWTRPYKPGAE